MGTSRRIALYVDPPSHHFLGDRLFDADASRLTSDRLHTPYAHLRDLLTARGIVVHTADYLPEREEVGVHNVYVSLGYLRDYRRLARRRDLVLSAFFALESPIVEPTLYRALGCVRRYFKRIFAWNDGAALERFVGQPVRCEPLRSPQAFDAVHEAIWSQTDRKFLVMINANKLPRVYWRELYTERLRAVEFFSRTGEIDLYGIGWDGPPYRVGKSWLPGTVRRIQRHLAHQWERLRPDPLLRAARRAYRGPVPSKAETLGQYTFAICFENVVLEGYVTEKLFDCFFAGTVPIYWGAPDIERHVPPECFIDMRRFASYADLAIFLKSLDQAQIQAYREHARAYLASPRYRPFTKEAFAERLCRIIEEDTGVSIR